MKYSYTYYLKLYHQVPDTPTYMEVYVGKTLAGYKHGRPLPVLPRNISQLSQRLPLNGVPGVGLPRLQVEGCQASNTSKAHNLCHMHKTRQ